MTPRGASPPPPAAGGTLAPAVGGRRRRVVAVLVALAVLLAADLARPGPRQLTARALVAAIQLYHATLSPAMPRLGVSCRFTPSCSRYGEAVIARHGALVGGAETVWRIVRCGPWTPAGTVDPPPP